MATAAALAFELVQRVSDVFGFEDPADPDAPDVRPDDRGIVWEDYQASQSIVVRQHKTGKRLLIPLVDGQGSGRTLLYPELEGELGRLSAGYRTGLIITEEGNGAARIGCRSCIPTRWMRSLAWTRRVKTGGTPCSPCIGAAGGATRSMRVKSSYQRSFVGMEDPGLSE